MERPLKKLKGKAKIQSEKHKKTLSFCIQPPGPENLSEALMGNFCDLDLSLEEKRLLTRNHRQELNGYRQMPIHEIQKKAQKLIKELKKTEQQSLQVQASDLGTFICLAAIYSGELPKNKTFSFELGLAPLKFFPTSLLKETQVSNSKIYFQYDEDCWLRHFKNLIWHQQLPEQSTFFDEDLQQINLPKAG